MKVCVAVPHGGTVKGRLMTDLIAALFALRNGIGFVLAEVEGTLGPRNRWLAGQQALETGCDFLWLVDNDMSIPQDALPRLLAHKKDLIGADYSYRRFPLMTTVKMLDGNGTITIPDRSTFPARPFICHAIGSGCKLVTCAALRRIPQPWFALSWGPEGDLVKTDDVWFCEQAKTVGIDTWCDPTLDVKHIGDHAYAIK
jgi:hypothetical protein